MEHREGSRKDRVHDVFKKQGKEAAIKKAVALKLKPTTARTWCSQFANEKGGKKKAAPAKAPAKKAKTAKAPAKKAAPARKRERVEERASA